MSNGCSGEDLAGDPIASVAAPAVHHTSVHRESEIRTI